MKQLYNILFHTIVSSSIIAWVCLLLFLPGCSPERHLNEGEYLLVKNVVKVDDKKVDVADDLVYVVRPQTNKKTFGLFLWRAGIYEAMEPQSDSLSGRPFIKWARSTFGKSPIVLDTAAMDYYHEVNNKCKKWVQNTMGEEPVLLDTTLIDYSLAQVHLMMFNNGYFNAQVTDQVKIKDKRAKVYYYVTAGEPYRINDIEYNIADTTIRRIILSDTNRRLIKRHDIYCVDDLKEEQERVTTRLQNRGYYYFSKNFVRYEIDTTIGNNLCNVKLIIDNPTYQVSDSVFVEGKHRIFTVESVNIYANYSQWDNETQLDTTYYTEIVRKTDTNDYVILYNGHKYHKQKTLVNPVYFNQGRTYSARASQITYDHYADLKNFDYIKVLYAETPESRANYSSDTGQLDCRIQLTNSKKRNIGLDFLLKNTGDRIGIGGSITHTDKNLFKGAEMFYFSVKYTQELQTDSNKTHFKNFEVGGTIGLEIPRFLFPIKQQNVSKTYRPKTNIELNANYMRQDYYDRFLSNISFTYKWGKRLSRNRLVRVDHSLSVLDFSIIKMYTGEDFDRIVSNYHYTRRIMEKYKDHFILGSDYNFTLQYSNKFILKTNLELFGNLLYASMAVFDKKGKTLNEYNQYTVWKIPFASGIAFDIDMVYDAWRKNKNALVFHMAAGVGVPILNSTTLPFENSFYLGGSNSVRAWRLRTLGPGGYANENALTIESVGDIKFEFNVEFRFQIYKVLQGAVFADAGNIWLLREHADYPKGNFDPSRFYKEIALDGGLGLRLDLSFIIIRLDYAMKFRNPAKEGSNAWQHFKWNSMSDYRQDRAIVFGIGYPF